MKAIVRIAAAAMLAVLPMAFAFAQDATENERFNPYIPASGPDLHDYVSPNLDPAEQALVRNYMNALPKAFKERIAGQPVNSISVAIVEGTTGAIHYNRPEDVGSYQVVSGMALPGAERPDMQSAVKNPGVYGGSGPYRRVYTIPLPAAPAPAPDEQGNYEQSGDVTTTCKSGNFYPGDRGYAYLGGWSGTWDTAGGPSAVDAGLIYNYEASLKSADDYSMFMNLGNGIGIISKGNAETHDGKEAELPPTHIACNAFGLATMTFSVSGTFQLPSVAPQCWQGKGGDAEWIGFPNAECSTYAMTLSVTSEFFDTYSGAHTALIIWVAPNITDGGWGHLVKFVSKYYNGKYNVPGYIASATCGGCMFKWMTSIAQPKGNTLSDGSYYGAVWFKREISGYALKESYTAGSPLIRTTKNLVNCSEYPLWHPPYSSDYQADCTNMPSGLKGAAQTVLVKDYFPDGEWDIIRAKF